MEWKSVWLGGAVGVISSLISAKFTGNVQREQFVYERQLTTLNKYAEDSLTETATFMNKAIRLRLKISDMQKFPAPQSPEMAALATEYNQLTHDYLAWLAKYEATRLVASVFLSQNLPPMLNADVSWLRVTYTTENEVKTAIIDANERLNQVLAKLVSFQRDASKSIHVGASRLRPN